MTILAGSSQPSKRASSVTTALPDFGEIPRSRCSLGMTILAGSSLPSRIDGLADEEFRVGAGTRGELLRAAVIDFRDVEIALLIHAEPVHSPEAAREITPGAPGVEQVSLQVVVQHLGGAAIEGPQRAVGADVDQVDVGRLVADMPLVEIFAVFVEDLNAVVAAVVDENVPRLRIDGDAVHVVEVAGTLVVWRRALHAPVQEEFAVLIELGHARAVVSVGNEECAVGQPDNVSWTVEVRAVGALYRGRADGLQELLAIMAELVNSVHVIVYDPDVLVGIVGVDVNGVGPLEFRIPLTPGLNDVAVFIDNVEAIGPFGVYADLTIRRIGAAPKPWAIVGILSGAAGPGHSCDRGVPPGQTADGE